MGVEAGTAIILIIALFAAITVWKGIRVVPQQEAWIVERLGKELEIWIMRFLGLPAGFLFGRHQVGGWGT